MAEPLARLDRWAADLSTHGSTDITLQQLVVALAFELDAWPAELVGGRQAMSARWARAWEQARQLDDPRLLSPTALTWGHRLLMAERLADARGVLAQGVTAARRESALQLGLLHRLQATEARLAGRWDDLDRCLRDGEASVARVGPADHAAELAGLLACERIEQAIALGTPDEAQRLLDALDAGTLPARVSLAATLALLRVDVALAAGRLHQARALVRTALGDLELLAAAPDLADRLSAREALARSESALRREDVEAAADALLDRLADPRGIPSRLLRQLRVHGAYASLLRGDLDGARHQLALARPADPIVARDLPPLRAALLTACEVQLAEADGQDDADVWARLHRRLDAELDQLIASWRLQDPEPGGAAHLYYGSTRYVLTGWFRTAERALGVEPAARQLLEHLGEIQAEGSLARAANWSGVTTEQLVEALGDDQSTLLCVLPAGAGSLLLVLHAGGIEVHRSLFAGELLELQRELLFEVGRAPAMIDGRPDPSARDRARAAGRALTEALVPDDVVRRFRRWVVVGSDLIGGWVPLGCLVGPDGRWLGLTHELVIAPSLPALVRLGTRPATRAPRRELAVIAAADPGPAALAAWPGLTPIPFGPAAARELTDAYGAATASSVSLDEQAHWPALRDALGSARVVHVLAHGVQDPGRTLPALLVMAPEGGHDGLVGTSRLAAATVVADTVVLAACGAGFGPMRSGEDGRQHPGGALLGAGARSVILSRARLDTAATLALCRALHQALGAGASPSAALLSARRALVSDPAFDHPAYHGLLDVFGVGWSPGGR